MRRVAVSILSNIAEGFESDTQAQFIRFLGHAKASAGEVRAQLYVALDVGHVTEDQFDALFVLTETCSRQLSAFISYLKAHRGGRRVGEAGIEYEINLPTFKPVNLPTSQHPEESQQPT